MSAVTPEAVFQLINKLLVDELDVDPDAITLDATLESLDVDSLDLVELLQIAEEEFGVQLNPEDAKDVKTVGQAIDLVVRRAQ